MKIPNWSNWARIILWLALIAFFSWLISQRFNYILNGIATTTDIIILLIWIALIAAFIFREVDFFGVRLKREIDNLRTEFREQIFNLRSDIQNTIITRTEFNPQIQILTPPTDSELQEVKKVFKSLEQTLKEKGIGIEKEIPKFEIPDTTKYLFEVRYTIENELRHIWKQWQARVKEVSLWKGQLAEELERPQSVFQIIRSLDELGIIDKGLSSVIREVYRACTPAIHGEYVSQTAVGFVRDVSPSLIASLQATKVTFIAKHKSEE
jgi:hypothetical protein